MGTNRTFLFWNVFYNQNIPNKKTTAQFGKLLICYIYIAFELQWLKAYNNYLVFKCFSIPSGLVFKPCKIAYKSISLVITPSVLALGVKTNSASVLNINFLAYQLITNQEYYQKRTKKKGSFFLFSSRTFHKTAVMSSFPSSHSYRLWAQGTPSKNDQMFLNVGDCVRKGEFAARD